MSKKLFILVGAAGSGKSTWVREHLHTFNGYVKVVSRDDIRFRLVSAEEEYFSKEKEVFNEFVEEIKNGLEYCENTVADATHLNEASRSKLLRALGSTLRDVEVDAIVIRTSLENALDHNENRKGTRSYVPKSVIKRMWYQQTMPSFDEGFDKIYIYQADKIGTKYTIIERDK